MVTGATGAEGNLLDNDAPGSALTGLQILDSETGEYVSVEAGTPVTVQGDYGSLTVSADGSYTYTPDDTAAHFTTAQPDTFEYQLVHASGEVATASLEVTVTPSGDGVPVPPAVEVFSFDEGDVIPLDGFAAESDELDVTPEADFQFALLEEQGSLEDVLQSFLSEGQGEAGGGDGDTGSISDPGPITLDPVVDDPLAYLNFRVDELDNSGNSVI